jgi:diphthamide synthase (EF-2-diphthine--ammonia ligase)
LDADAVNELIELNRRYGVGICGEGGEMETLVQDAPWFKKRLEITSAKSVWNGIRGSYIVEGATLRPKAAHAQRLKA